MTIPTPSPSGVFSRKSVSDFQKMLDDRYLFHKEKAERHVRIYKIMGFGFGLAIPILAALVTFFMGSEFGMPRSCTAFLGMLLTLLTIVNSVLKPDERFARSAQHGILLHEWKREFDIALASTGTDDEKALYNLIREMDTNLSEIGRVMAEGFIPKPQA